MFDDITEFTRFYQTGTGQRVAGLIRQQLGSFWPSGSSSSVAFLGYAQPFVDKGAAALGMMPARRGRRHGQNHHRFEIVWLIRQICHFPMFILTGC